MPYPRPYVTTCAQSNPNIIATTPMTPVKGRPAARTAAPVVCAASVALWVVLPVTEGVDELEAPDVGLADPPLLALPDADGVP